MGKTAWLKSSYSNGPSNNCVEINLASHAYAQMRDSKNPTTEIWIGRKAWSSFLAQTKSGAYDRTF